MDYKIDDFVLTMDQPAPVRHPLLLFSALRPEQAVKLCLYSWPDAEWFYYDDAGVSREFIAPTHWKIPDESSALQQQEAGWRDIETLPDDITEALVYSPDDSQDGGPCITTAKQDTEYGWKWWEPVDGNPLNNVTHWQPLPLPPSASSSPEREPEKCPLCDYPPVCDGKVYGACLKRGTVAKTSAQQPELSEEDAVEVKFQIAHTLYTQDPATSNGLAMTWEHCESLFPDRIRQVESDAEEVFQALSRIATITRKGS